jgi:hypothetical protein
MFSYHLLPFVMFWLFFSLSLIEAERRKQDDLKSLVGATVPAFKKESSVDNHGTRRLSTKAKSLLGASDGDFLLPGEDSMKTMTLTEALTDPAVRLGAEDDGAGKTSTSINKALMSSS